MHWETKKNSYELFYGNIHFIGTKPAISPRYVRTKKISPKEEGKWSIEEWNKRKGKLKTSSNLGDQKISITTLNVNEISIPIKKDCQTRLKKPQPTPPKKNTQPN